MDAIFTRTSVRAYADRPVEPEKLERLLRAGMAAPSARNQQPWEFYVTTDRARLQALSGCSPYVGFVKNATASKLRYPMVQTSIFTVSFQLF